MKNKSIDILEVENGYLVNVDRNYSGDMGKTWIAETREKLADLIMELAKKEKNVDPVLMDRKEL